MTYFFDLLKSYLYSCVMILFTPISVFISILTQETRLKDSLNITFLLAFIGLSIGFAISSNSEFSLNLLPLLFLPLILYIVSIKLSWIILRKKIPMDVVICQALIFIGINCLVATIGLAPGLFFLKAYDPPLYQFIFTNDYYTISQSLVTHLDVWERHMSNKGLRYFILSSYFFSILSALYWILFSIAAAIYQKQHWILGFFVGVISTILCLLSGYLLVMIF